MAKLLCATIFVSATLTCSAECRADELWSCRTKYENGDAFAARFQTNGDKLVPIGGSIQFQIIEYNTEHVLAWYSFLDKNLHVTTIRSVGVQTTMSRGTTLNVLFLTI